MRSAFRDSDADEREIEVGSGGLAAALLQPAGVIVGTSDHDDLVSSKRA